MFSEENVRQIKRRHSAKLLSMPGVSGVGVEKDEMGDFHLAIHVTADLAAKGINLPRQIENCPVRLIQGEPFFKL